MLNGKRTYSGCVATAMAQVLNWHKYPARATGTKTYTWENGGKQTLSADLSEKALDWNNMLANYSNGAGTTAQREAVAWLMKVCACSVNTDYGGDSEGGSGATPSVVARALNENFSYDAGAEYKYRCFYEETEWDNMLVESLQQNGPIIYAGFGSGGGHCFVFDGCKTDGTFHINWGWSGSSDGYFRTSSVNPSSLGAGGGTGGGFSDNQGAVFYMKRPAGGTRPDPFLGSAAGMNCSFSTSGTSIRADFGVDNSAELLYNRGSYKGNFGIKTQLKAENGATYDTDIDYAELESGWGWKGMNLFYYTLPTVPDGV